MFDDLNYSELVEKLMDAIEMKDGRLIKKIKQEISERIAKYE